MLSIKLLLVFIVIFMMNSVHSYQLISVVANYTQNQIFCFDLIHGKGIVYTKFVNQYYYKVYLYSSRRVLFVKSFTSTGLILQLAVSDSGKYLGYIDKNYNGQLYQARSIYFYRFAWITSSSVITNIMFGNEDQRQLFYSNYVGLVGVFTNKKMNNFGIQFDSKLKILAWFRFWKFDTSFIRVTMLKIQIVKIIRKSIQYTTLSKSLSQIIKAKQIIFKSNNSWAIFWVTQSCQLKAQFCFYSYKTICYQKSVLTKLVLIQDMDVRMVSNRTFIVIVGFQSMQTFQIIFKELEIKNDEKYQILQLNFQTVHYNLKKIRIYELQNLKLLAFFSTDNGIYSIKISLKPELITYTLCKNSLSFDQKRCNLCQIPCLTCLGQNNSCQSCVVGYYQLGYKCKKCKNFNCKNCDEFTCKKCFHNYFLVDQICLHCLDVLPHCLKCIDIKTCAFCHATALLINQTCKACSQIFFKCQICNQLNCLKCEIGAYLLYAYRSNYCLQCSFQCLSCDLNATKCTECKKNYQMQKNGSCIEIIIDNKSNDTQNNPQNNTQNDSQNTSQNTSQNASQNTAQNTTQKTQNDSQTFNNSNDFKDIQKDNDKKFLLSFTKLQFVLFLEMKVNSHLNTIAFYAGFNIPYQLQGKVSQSFHCFIGQSELQYFKNTLYEKKLYFQMTYNSSHENQKVYCIVDRSLILGKIGNQTLAQSHYDLSVVNVPYLQKKEQQNLELISYIGKNIMSNTRSIASGLIPFGGLALILSLINFSQLVSLYVILKLEYPANLRFGLQSFLQLQTHGLYPKLFQPYFTHIIDYDPLPNKIKEYGFQINFISANLKDMIIIVAVFFLNYLIAKIIVPWIPSNCLYKCLRTATVKKNYEKIALQFQGSILSFVFSASLAIRYPLVYNSGTTVNFLFATFIYGGCLLYIFLNWVYLRNNWKNPSISIDGCLMDMNQTQQSSYYFIVIKMFGDFFVAGFILFLQVQIFVPIVIIFNSYLLYLILNKQIYELKIFKITRFSACLFFILLNFQFIIFYINQKVYHFVPLSIFWNMGYAGIGLTLLIALINTFESLIGVGILIKQFFQWLCQNKVHNSPSQKQISQEEKGQSQEKSQPSEHQNPYWQKNFDFWQKKLKPNGQIQAVKQNSINPIKQQKFKDVKIAKDSNLKNHKVSELQPECIEIIYLGKKKQKITKSRKKNKKESFGSKVKKQIKLFNPYDNFNKKIQ